MDLNHLPHVPGVYLMRDSQARITYIGKAKDLKKRVSSYFQNRPFSSKLSALVSLIQQVDYIPAASEKEALLLEQKLIRRFQPVYNTLWRDDKSYPYLKLTMNEDYPRLVLTRRKNRDGARYFGPYPNVGMIRNLLRFLWRRKIFPLRPCHFPFLKEEIQKGGGLEDAHPSLYKKVQSCLYLHNGECPAPCMNKISHENYAKIASSADLFFSGRRDPLKISLQNEMENASRSLRYEQAAQMRDQISALEYLSQGISIKRVDEGTVAGETNMSRILTELQRVLDLPRPPLRIEGFDISNIQGVDPVASLVVFDRGKPLKSDYRKFKIKTVQGPDDFAMMGEVVKRRYLRVLRERGKLPDLVLIDGGKGQLNSALKSMEKCGSAAKRIPICSLAKENEEIFLPNRSEAICLPKDSPALHILQSVRDEAHRFAVTFHRHRRDQRAMGGCVQEP